MTGTERLKRYESQLSEARREYAERVATIRDGIKTDLQIWVETIGGMLSTDYGEVIIWGNGEEVDYKDLPGWVAEARDILDRLLHEDW